MNLIPVQIELIDGRATLLKSITLAGVIVPAGYVTDGISSPRIFWSIFHPFSKYVPAAIIHDYCIGKFGYNVARDKFKRALKESGANSVTLRALYYSVRLKDWAFRLKEKFVNLGNYLGVSR